MSTGGYPNLVTIFIQVKHLLPSLERPQINEWILTWDYPKVLKFWDT